MDDTIGSLTRIKSVSALPGQDLCLLLTSENKAFTLSLSSTGKIRLHVIAVPGSTSFMPIDSTVSHGGGDVIVLGTKSSGSSMIYAFSVCRAGLDNLIFGVPTKLGSMTYTSASDCVSSSRVEGQTRVAIMTLQGKFCVKTLQPADEPQT